MSKLAYTPLDEIDRIYADLKTGFASGKTKSIPYRKYQLLQLAYMLKDNVKRFEEALAADLGRPPLEARFLDIDPSIVEVKAIYANVEKWAKAEKPAFSLNWTPMRPIIRKEPKGVVLIISPFNYPLFLTILPLAAAIAAGNAVLLKPSEANPATSGLLAELMPKYLEPSLIHVVNGSVPETTKLLEYPWGHILYTGGGKVGRIVATAAAKNLTPITLELGGKSPVFIDPNCDVKLAAKRILWGKAANAGQTCVAPDYVLVPKDFQDTFIQALKDSYKEFYPDSPAASGQMSRLATSQAYARINGLLEKTKGTVVLGGDKDEATKFIAPTVVKDVQFDDSLMSEEIFGPILPVVPIRDVDEGIAYVNANDHPLSLYVFTQDEKFKFKVFNSTQSGSAIANETIIHPGAEGLPFGGIGPSGSGYHTGKFGFDTFTHLRSSLDSPKWLEFILGFRYPPYDDKKTKAVSKIMNTSLPARPSGPPTGDEGSKSWTRWFSFVLALVLAGGLMRRQIKT